MSIARKLIIPALVTAFCLCMSLNGMAQTAQGSYSGAVQTTISSVSADDKNITDVNNGKVTSVGCDTVSATSTVSTECLRFMLRTAADSPVQNPSEPQKGPETPEPYRNNAFKALLGGSRVSGVGIHDGSLRTSYSLPSIKRGDRDLSVTLFYDSTAAYPSSLMRLKYEKSFRQQFPARYSVPTSDTSGYSVDYDIRVGDANGRLIYVCDPNQRPNPNDPDGCWPELNFSPREEDYYILANRFDSASYSPLNHLGTYIDGGGLKINVIANLNMSSGGGGGWTTQPYPPSYFYSPYYDKVNSHFGAGWAVQGVPRIIALDQSRSFVSYQYYDQYLAAGLTREMMGYGDDENMCFSQQHCYDGCIDDRCKQERQTCVDQCTSDSDNDGDEELDEECYKKCITPCLTDDWNVWMCNENCKDDYDPSCHNIVVEPMAVNGEVVQDYSVYFDDGSGNIRVFLKKEDNVLTSSEKELSGLRSYYDSPPGDASTLYMNRETGSDKIAFVRHLADDGLQYFDEEGYIIEAIDRTRTNVVRYEYDDMGQITPPGQTTTIPIKRIKTISYELHMKDVHNDNIPTQVYVLGVYSFFYKENGYIDRIQDSEGRITKFSVDTNGNVKEITDLNSQTTIRYNYGEGLTKPGQNHLLTSVVDPLGVQTGDNANHTVSYDYFDIGRVRKVTGPPDKNDRQDRRAMVDISPLALRQLDTNPTSNAPGAPDCSACGDYDVVFFNNGTYEAYSVKYKTETNGSITEFVDALGRTTTVTQKDDNGNPTEVKLNNDRIITQTFDDDKGFLLTTNQNNILSSAPEKFTYDAFGTILTYTDMNNNEPTRFINYNGNIQQVTEPGKAGKMEFGYLNNSTFLEYTTDQVGLTTKFNYDESGTWNLKSVTDPRNQTLIYERDAFGNIRCTRMPDDPTGCPNAENFYDTQNRLIAHNRTRNGSYNIAYKYDANGNLLDIKETGQDPYMGIIENVTHNDYDNLGRVTLFRNAAGETTAFDYDLRGNTTKVTKNSGQRIESEYDNGGQVILQRRYDANNNPVNYTNFTYDAQMGYMTDVSDWFSSLHTDYDDAGRALRVQTQPMLEVPASFRQPATTIDFDYDNNNNTRYYQFGGESVVYTYDSNNRLRTIYKENTGGFGFAYDDADRLTQRTLPNNTETRYYYFNAQPYTGLLMEQQHAVSNSTILIEAQHVSDYNLSNPTPTIRSVDVRAPEGNSKYVYAYQDIDDRASSSRSYLISAKYTSPTLSRLDLFRYSFEGNRRNSYSVQVPASSVAKCASDWTTCPGATAFTYEHDGKGGSNWDSSKTNRVIEDTGHIYQYDADGNMRMRTDKATGNRTIYTYTIDNQLTRAETYTPAGVKLMESNYRYDALGRRIAKVVGRPGSGQPPYIRKYVYLGDNPLAAYDETNNLVTRYEYTGAVDDILMVKEDLNRDGSLMEEDNEFFYYKDLFGNVTHIIGKNHNNKVKQYKYSPYGQLFSEWTSPGIHPNFENNILFTAREWDAELNLYYLRARHYDPDTGKFLQEDPVFNLNLYNYGNNNPILYIDPFGRRAIIVNSHGHLEMYLVTTDPDTGESKVEYYIVSAYPSGKSNTPLIHNLSEHTLTTREKWLEDDFEVMVIDGLQEDDMLSYLQNNYPSGHWGYVGKNEHTCAGWVIHTLKYGSEDFDSNNEDFLEPDAAFDMLVNKFTKIETNNSNISFTWGTADEFSSYYFPIDMSDDLWLTSTPIKSK